MTEYYVPTKPSETEFTEKRSRFLGHVWPVESEAAARVRVDEMKKYYHDARHNCWCYLLREGNIVRYSDDGEPQGTAGQPMLGVFQKEGITNVVCVVTRYFGGVLLGAGGLTRAYGRAAKDALDAAGISVVRPWTLVEAECPYPLFDRVRMEVSAVGGVEGAHVFGSTVTLRVLLPEGGFERFSARLRECSAGVVLPKMIGEEWQAVPAVSMDGNTEGRQRT